MKEIGYIRETKRLLHELAVDESCAIGKGDAITNFLKYAKGLLKSYVYAYALQA